MRQVPEALAVDPETRVLKDPKAAKDLRVPQVPSASPDCPEQQACLVGLEALVSRVLLAHQETSDPADRPDYLDLLDQSVRTSTCSFCRHPVILAMNGTRYPVS